MMISITGLSINVNLWWCTVKSPFCPNWSKCWAVSWLADSICSLIFGQMVGGTEGQRSRTSVFAWKCVCVHVCWPWRPCKCWKSSAGNQRTATSMFLRRSLKKSDRITWKRGDEVKNNGNDKHKQTNVRVWSRRWVTNFDCARLDLNMDWQSSRLCFQSELCEQGTEDVNNLKSNSPRWPHARRQRSRINTNPQGRKETQNRRTQTFLKQRNHRIKSNIFRRLRGAGSRDLRWHNGTS